MNICYLHETTCSCVTNDIEAWIFIRKLFENNPENFKKVFALFLQGRNRTNGKITGKEFSWKKKNKHKINNEAIFLLLC